MKILIVSYVDDNFGDNLIRICFEQLLNVVLKNLKVDLRKIEIKKMALKQIDEDLVTDSDLIAFAGGGLFGLSYLNFFDWVNRIIELADENEIPVFFSSMGMNNMDANSENEHLLKSILRHPCIKAFSVRENLHTFRQYASGCDFEICKVCDPAVWTKYVYHSYLSGIQKGDIVGINVVRGGLFSDNDKQWGLSSELKYLNELKQELDERGIRYVFYTNGSFLDDNSLHYYADKFDIPPEQLVYPNTTREWVQTVARFNRVACIRMHSSIVSYALETPSVNLIWNDKIPFFYQNIGYPDRAIDLADWNGGHVLEQLEKIKGEDYGLDHEYMMSLYRYLYKIMRTFTSADAGEDEIFDFDTVRAELESRSVSPEEDTLDLVLKLSKSEKHYLSRFKDLKQKEEEEKLRKKELSKKTKEIEKLKRSLEKTNRLPSVRIAKALARAVRKLRKKLGQ